MSDDKLKEILREMARRIMELEKVVAGIDNYSYNPYNNKRKGL